MPAPYPSFCALGLVTGTVCGLIVGAYRVEAFEDVVAFFSALACMPRLASQIRDFWVTDMSDHTIRITKI